MLALEGEASFRSRSVIMPTSLPWLTTGKRRKRCSFMIWMALIMEVSSLMVMGSLVIQSLISMVLSGV